MKRILIISAISLLTFTYCTKTVEGQYSDNNKVNFEEGQYVSFACGVPQTKASGTYSDNAISFAWQDGDKLQVKVGEATGVLTYSASTEMFSGKMPAAGETFDLQWPNFEPTLSSQDYVVGGIDPKLIKATITGCSLSQTNISLTPANTVMCFKLSGTDKFKTIELLQNGTDNKYTLVMGTEATLTSSYSRYFIVVPKGETWSDGLTLSVKDKDGNEIWSQKTNKSISTNSPITMEKQTVVKKLMYKGHEYVDLGFYVENSTIMRSGVSGFDSTKTLKWATCNIGAENGWSEGDYFAWGETSTKSSFTTKNYTYTGAAGWGDKLSDDNDAAHAIWGGKWRIPTRQEWWALFGSAYGNDFKTSACSISSVSSPNVAYKVTSKSDNTKYIYLEKPTHSIDGTTKNENPYLSLWTSNGHQTNGQACITYYQSNYNHTSGKQYMGRGIRPVFSGLPD